MDISVVIPTYNRASLLPRALDSVLRQSYPAREIIVVDDGSTDETAKLLDRYGSSVIVIRQENRGVSAARNRGIEQATGEWIALLDSDDAWMPRKLRNQKEFHHNNPALEIFQSREIWIRNGRRVNLRKKHQKTGGWIFTQSLPLCIVSPSAVIFKKSLWRETGGFDPGLPVAEDYDFWLRVLKNRPIGLDEKESVIKYGGHEDQLSRTTPLMDYYRVRAMAKHLRDENLNSEYFRELVKNMQLKLEILIKGAIKHDGNLKEYLRLEKEVAEAVRRRPRDFDTSV